MKVYIVHRFGIGASAFGPPEQVAAVIELQKTNIGHARRDQCSTGNHQGNFVAKVGCQHQVVVVNGDAGWRYIALVGGFEPLYCSAGIEFKKKESRIRGVLDSKGAKA